MSEDATHLPLGATFSDAEIADALADRALSRAVSSLAVASFALVVMALLFLVMSGGTLDARSLPQVVLLLTGHLAGVSVAAACLRSLRRLRVQVDDGSAGSGPAAAGAAVPWLSRLVVGVPLLSVVAVVVLAATVPPLSETVLSGAVGLAVVSQLSVLAAVQRSGLLRAAGGAEQCPGVSRA
jgi:hypothetical protein